MGRLEQRRRNLNKRKRKSIIVIGCEGKNKTETIYFKNFSSRKCIIKFSTGKHTDPLGIANDLIDFIKNEIKSKIPCYSESMNVYPIIKDKTSIAIANAKKIERYQRENGQVIDSEGANPHTSAYRVVEELIKRNNLSS